MERQFNPDPQVNDMWRNFIQDCDSQEVRVRNFMRLLPTGPRCKSCYAPFKGIGGAFVRLAMDKRPSTHNPLICNRCERFADEHPGGVETEMSMLFADVRGSTVLAETMSPYEFSRLINRFYRTSIEILANHDAIIDRLVGDEMIGYFLPCPAGGMHARQAVLAAQALLVATGHDQPDGPWIPVGISVHSGVAFFGAVGDRDGMKDITALGTAPNLAARLASLAAKGEILISESAYKAAGLDLGETEKRSLALKGITEPVKVRAILPGEEIQRAIVSG